MSSKSTKADDQPATRDRLVESALALFSRNGYSATGVKAVLSAANTPYGSLYHWFPGGKQELGVAALDHGGTVYRRLLEERYPPDRDVIEATEKSFLELAEILVASEYGYACPIATIALEVASNDEAMRNAAHDAFQSWLDFLRDRLLAEGLSKPKAEELAVELLCLMEGSMLLARTAKSTDAVKIVGRAAAKAVSSAIAEARAN